MNKIFIYFAFLIFATEYFGCVLIFEILVTIKQVTLIDFNGTLNRLVLFYAYI